MLDKGAGESAPNRSRSDDEDVGLDGLSQLSLLARIRDQPTMSGRDRVLGDSQEGTPPMQPNRIAGLRL